MKRRKITKEQLWNAILDDFQSEENKKIQEMLINDVPKYGNDDDYVDQLVVEAYDSYLDEIKKYPNTRYHRGPIGGISLWWNVIYQCECWTGNGNHCDSRWKKCI